MKKKNKTYYKQTGLMSVKVAEVTQEILQKINTYAQQPLTEEEVYVQKYLLAHNGVDRDRERFPEDLLDDYASTLPGKSLLEVHDKHRLPVGLYFDAITEEMPPEQFRSLTGEDIRLPEGIETAKVVFAWIYTLRKEWNQKLIDNLSAGIYRHTSIGFSATDLKPVKGEFDQILYFEYMAPGEAREGSIVHLGAQQGAIVQKDPDIQEFKSSADTISGGKTMTLNSWLKGQTCSDEFCKVDGTYIKGQSLAALLNRRINQRANDDVTRADIIQEMAQAAGIAPGTVSQILNGSINCPPINRLEGFASALGLSINTIISAARKDGCEYENKDINLDNINRGGKRKMEELKQFLEKLSKEFKTLFTEENAADEIRALIDANETKAATDLTAKNKEISDLKAEIEALKPVAADGKAYRDGLVEECIKMKAKLGDISEKEEDQKSVRSTVEKFDIGYLKKEKEILEKRVAEKFPDDPQLKGDAKRDRSGNVTEDNPLIPKKPGE